MRSFRSRWPESVVRLAEAGITTDDAYALRRISMTLHRWHELECGDGNDYGSWTITRGRWRTFIPETGKPVRTFEHDESEKPFLERHSYSRPGSCVSYVPIPDRERGALKRLAAIMARYPALQFYVQGDPRGASLYILRPGDVPEFDGWSVWCLDDTARDGTRGAMIRATSQTFATHKEASAYLDGVAPSRAPEIRRVPADVSAYYSRGVAVYK